MHTGGKSQSESSSDDEHTMTDEHTRNIQSQRVKLVKTMRPHGVLDYLLENKVLCDRDAERILGKGPADFEINEALTSAIVKTSERGYWIFIKALRETYQKHLANLVEEKKGEPIDLKLSAAEVETRQAVTDDLRKLIETHMYEKIAHILSSQPDPSTGLACVSFLMEKGRKLIEVLPSRSVLMRILCPTVDSADDLWFSLKDGRLKQLCQSSFITSELKEKLGVTSVELDLQISEEQYLMARKKLADEMAGRGGYSADDEYSTDDVDMRSEGDRQSIQTHSDGSVQHTNPPSTEEIREEMSEARVESIQTHYKVLVQKMNPSDGSVQHTNPPSTEEIREEMSEDRVESIQTHYKVLVQKMNPAPIITHLLSRHLLTDRDARTIRSKGVDEDVNEALLSEIMKMPDIAYDELKQSLKASKKGYLADKLDVQNIQ